MSVVSVRRAMKSSGLLAASALSIALFSTPAAHALPVIPGAAGFGMETPAGRGGTVYRVTNLNASGSGSLKACIDGTTPRTCVFEVSGVIRITSDLMIRNSKIHIAGQTAPSPGIMIRGAALKIQASDVVVQHIRVRAGDDTNGPDPENRDSLKIEGSSSKPVRNIVIDHCSFSWAIDEVVSVWGPHDNITFSNNIFAEPLNESIHPSKSGSGYEKHGFGVLLGRSSGSSITMTGNLFAHIVERNPLSRASELVFVNNLVYNRANMDLDLQSEGGASTRNTVLSNVFVKGPSYARDTGAVYIRTSGSLRVGSSSRVYQSGNSENYPRDVVMLFGGDIISGLLNSSTYPVWNGGLVRRSTADNAVYDRVLAYAGARPKDRDSVDKRVINHVKNRNGGVINCVSSNGSSRCNKNAGGWPSYSQNRRTLTLPSNHASIASNGYSNLENWLHSLDQQTSGTMSTNSPSAPASLSVQ